MPRMTRTHYNLVADATHAIIDKLLSPDARIMGATGLAVLRAQAAAIMTDAVAGTNSQFKADRFKAHCLGQIKGPR